MLNSIIASPKHLYGFNIFSSASWKVIIWQEEIYFEKKYIKKNYFVKLKMDAKMILTTRFDGVTYKYVSG